MLQPNLRTHLPLLAAMVIPTLAAVIYFVLSSDSVVGKVAYGIDKLFLLFFPAVATFLFYKKSPPPPLREPDRRRSLVLGILSGVAISAAAFGLLHTPLGDAVHASAPAISEKAHSLGFAQHYLAFAIFLSVAHSAIEEMYWRWFVYRRTRGAIKSPTAAHTVAALTFAAHHLVILCEFFPLPHAIAFAVCTGIGGAIWSVLYQRTGSLLGPWVSHMIVDFALMAIGHQLITSVAA